MPILEKPKERGVLSFGAALILMLTLMLVALAFAGCAPGGTAQSPSVAATPDSATPLPAATSVEITATTTATVTAGDATSVPVTGTSTVTATIAGPPPPTPTGEPPDPLSQLNILVYFDPQDSLVKRDAVDLDGSGPNEILFTVSGNRVPISAEVSSRVAVLTYDEVYRTWSLPWVSEPITGTAHPLPAANRSAAGGYNGGNILGTGSAIFAARTTTRDGRANLYVWRWDAAARQGVPLRMVNENNAESEAVFTADLDLNLADLDDDGIYEVVADNVSDMRVWRWDAAANRFAPEVTR